MVGNGQGFTPADAVRPATLLHSEAGALADAGAFAGTGISFALAALGQYRALMHSAQSDCPQKLLRPVEAEFGLGGWLLLVGGLTDADRAVIVGSNVAGAASLVVAEAEIEGKTALRDGIVDFLVTSLDEALRILKNEVRKRLPVSVGVRTSATKMIAEMLERGVHPDLLSAGCGQSIECKDFVSHGSFVIHGSFVSRGAFVIRGDEQIGTAAPETVVAWRGTPSALSRLNSVVLETLPETAIAEKRWLRFSPRYLGRLAQGFRCVDSARPLADRLMVRMSETIKGEGLDAAVDILA